MILIQAGLLTPKATQVISVILDEKSPSLSVGIRHLKPVDLVLHYFQSSVYRPLERFICTHCTNQVKLSLLFQALT